MNHAQRRARGEWFAHFHELAETYRVIDAIRRLHAPRTQAQRRERHAHRVDIVHEARARRRECDFKFRLR